ncbi:hypothetical protein PYS58_10440 [Chryseobacterium indologenes]|uniref:hypothetical protein n=1 Tax=Chryseobacterium indologenes TaxID=253 RepID=UPI0023E80E84|nr:hypothetical protein [Chryseobacterium indologenes]WET51545.1 hypothetical protein PYS58_10440 [Chryseobacterium indologenes]
MITKEFIEEYSLFRKLKLSTPLDNFLYHWQKVPINMQCNHCNSIQTFNLVNNYGFISPGGPQNYANDRVVPLQYKCESCQKFERYFYVYVNSELNEVYKVGQYPEWEIKIDKGLQKTLNKHSDNFRKGLVCESQGYGIGAFAYYRRITEDIIDELLDSIQDLIDEENKEKYLAALEKTKQTRVTQEKIELIKDLLPSILKPNGVNPLGVLHSELSGGLHSESDEICLEKANHVKSILTFLINQVLKSKEDAKSFTESMKFLLDKKSGK